MADYVNNETIMGAHLRFPNLAGAKTIYNAEGDRNFLLVIPSEERAMDLMAKGWAVKANTNPRDPQDIEYRLKVKVNYRNDKHKPMISSITSDGAPVLLTEETVGEVDKADIDYVDITISPNPWNRPDGSSGITAYVKKMNVFLNEDPLTAAYNKRFGNRVAVDTSGNLAMIADDEDLPF